MLVLTRKPGEKTRIGNNITVTVVETKGNRVRLAFEAPDRVCILRSELVGNQPYFVPEYQPLDPDLASKPAEWEDCSPYVVMSR